MSVSAIIVTRGDVELRLIRESFPKDWEILQWHNGDRLYILIYDDDCRGWVLDTSKTIVAAPDLSVYGRYAAIQYASHDLIYVQDDDCIVSDPQKIVDTWSSPPPEWLPDIGRNVFYDSPWTQGLVANMPQEFRPHYPDSCLVGFGACFHRDLPARAFQSYFEADDWETGIEVQDLFLRTADVVFTTLTPRVLVDVPVEVLPYAHDSNRMWKQPDHYGERTHVLEMARKVRDA